MPIKPENLHLYGPREERLKIRAEVLEREQNACKNCGVQNYAIGYRQEGGRFIDVTGDVNTDAGIPKGLFRIVLTIAHLDQDPTNNGEPGNRPNLAALCQRCHLNHDRAFNLSKSRGTRLINKGQTTFMRAMVGWAQEPEGIA